jgi:hypothetical protein
MKLIYKPWGSNPSENPKGFPADYPRDSMRVEDGADVPSGWIEMSESAYNSLIASHYAEVASINAIDSSVPEEVLLYQFRAAVTLAGLKDAVDAAIQALPTQSRIVATEKWEYGNTVRRNHPMTVSLGAAVGLTPSQIDDIFRTASTIQ